MSKRKLKSLKKYQRLQERADYLQRLCAVTQADVQASNEQSRIVTADWNTLCLTLYRVLQITPEAEDDYWIAKDSVTGEVIARAKSMSTLFEMVLKVRLEEARIGVPDESL